MDNIEQVTGSALTDVSDIPEGRYCAYSTGVKQLCVTDLRVAFDYGLQNVARAVFEGDGPRYLLTFRVLELSHFPLALTHPGQPAASKVALRWQLQIKDNRGKVLSAVTKNTESPKLIYHDTDATEALSRLVETALNDVVGVLDSFGKEH